MRERFARIEEYTKGLELTQSADTRSSKRESARKGAGTGATGFCIGCADEAHLFNSEKPRCNKRYKAVAAAP